MYSSLIDKGNGYLYYNKKARGNPLQCAESGEKMRVLFGLKYVIFEEMKIK